MTILEKPIDSACGKFHPTSLRRGTETSDMNNVGAMSEGSYLALAKAVLRKIRRPLTPREILATAYRDGLVPKHLFGRTQHKTLQARLSEDILGRRDDSAFFRSEPGRFFLREFIADESLPKRFRTPIIARRRVRDLPKKGVLALDRQALGAVPSGSSYSADDFAGWVADQAYHYAKNNQLRDRKDVFVWAFVMVVKGTSVLSYRHGRYREGRDSFVEKRCVGFYSLVTGSDLTLFDQVDHGVVSAGLRGVAMDLDIPFHDLQASVSVVQSGFVYCQTGENHDLLGLMKYESPAWFEPLNRRLSLNDLTWLDITHAPNNIDDFDPWSQVLLERVRAGAPFA